MNNSVGIHWADYIDLSPCWTLDSIANKGYAPMVTLVKGAHIIAHKFTFSEITIIPSDSMWHKLESL